MKKPTVTEEEFYSDLLALCKNKCQKFGCENIHMTKPQKKTSRTILQIVSFKGKKTLWCQFCQIEMANRILDGVVSFVKPKKQIIEKDQMELI